MIVNYVDGSWEIVPQRTHGLLAAQLAFHWKEEDRPVRWLETIIACAEHDDATNELEDDDLLNDSGGPRNFKENKFNKDHCERLINLALSKSKYIAVLTAEHINFLYNKEEFVEGKSYCKKLQILKRNWLQELGLDEDESRVCYRILEWSDAFSLLICQQQIQPENRKIEISVGPDFRTYRFFQRENGSLSVEPWPYAVDEFVVRYETKVLDELTFKDNESFRRSLVLAPSTFKELRICVGGEKK